jgi:hypothetical protein
MDVLDEYFNDIYIAHLTDKGITKEELERYNEALTNYLYSKEKFEVAKAFYEGVCRGLDFKYSPIIGGEERETE